MIHANVWSLNPSQSSGFSQWTCKTKNTSGHVNTGCVWFTDHFCWTILRCGSWSIFCMQTFWTYTRSIFFGLVHLSIHSHLHFTHIKSQYARTHTHTHTARQLDNGMRMLDVFSDFQFSTMILLVFLRSLPSFVLCHLYTLVKSITFSHFALIAVSKIAWKSQYV